MTGGVTSKVQVAVRVTGVALWPQASTAFQVLVWLRKQPLTTTVASVKVGVTDPQASVAVAVPRAASIIAAVGLHPRTPLVGVPVAVMTGGVTSKVQVAVRVTGVALLPQASTAFQVLVWLRKQPLTTTVASVKVGVTDPQASVAVAVPRAASIIAAVGLHPRTPLVGVPVAVMTGGVTSKVQVAVRVTGVALLPQASTAFQVLVWLRKQPLTTTVASVEVGVTDPQASVAVAVPRAVFI